MKRFLAVTAAFALVGSTMAADLNVSVESGGSNAISVAPGEVVTYVVIGELSDAMNEGLALFGFDLSYDGDNLDQAAAGEQDITDGFVTPDGINNPAGFGGTDIGGDLVQVGGGQNTIKNDIGNAPFPIGVVITGIADPGSPAILATGQLTIPGDATEGTVFNLTLSNLFANVIREGESGEPPQNFWKTEAAGVGSIDNLQMTVSSACVATFASADPANCAIDAGQPTEPDGSGSFGVDAVVLNDIVLCEAADPSLFNVTSDGTPPTITSVVETPPNAELQLSNVVPTDAWTCFEYIAAGETTCVGYLPADIDGSGTSNGADVLAMTTALDGGTAADVDRDGVGGPEDLLRTIDLLNGGDSYAVWFGESLSVCPS